MRTFYIIQIDYLQRTVATDHRDLLILQIYHLVGILNDRSSIGSQEKFTFANPDYQRTALAGCDDFIGIVAVHHGDGVRPYHLPQGKLYGSEQVDVVGRLYILYQLNQHFRVRTAVELIAFCLKFFLQHCIIFNNTVMNKGEAPGRGIMRMSIGGTRFPVSGPTSMGNTDSTGNIFLTDESFEVCHFPFRLVYIQLTTVTDQCYPSTIIPAILQPLQSFDKNGVGFSVTYIAYDSTHNSLYFLRFAVQRYAFLRT